MVKYESNGEWCNGNTPAFGAARLKVRILAPQQMNKILRIIFITIFLFSTYHLIRDLLTNFGIHNYIVDFAHRSHLWCGQFNPWVCRWITVPSEIFNIIVSLIVLKRSNVGVLGILVLIQVPFWLLLVFLP